MSVGSEHKVKASKEDIAMDECHVGEHKVKAYYHNE